MNIVLVYPEIPQNTGNIARTCAATGTTLHLIEPLGFKIEDKYVKRAGLDYWNLMTYRVYENWQAFLRENPNANMYFATTKAKKNHCEVKYQEDDYLVFGCETKGLPEDLICPHYDNAIRVPMRSDARSLNLSNSVAVVLYEALRQLDFLDLLQEGALHGTGTGHWEDYV